MRSVPALPAPVQGLVDSIGVKLEFLAPQLALLDEQSPAAAKCANWSASNCPS
jgi:hypothetical protein